MSGCGAGVEPGSRGYEPHVVPFHYPASVGVDQGIEPCPSDSQSDLLPLHHIRRTGRAARIRTGTAAFKAQCAAVTPRPIWVSAVGNVGWSGWQVSNLRPLAPKARALPTELHPVR